MEAVVLALVVAGMINSIKNFVFGGIVVYDYSQAWVVEGDIVGISIYLHWKRRFWKTRHTTCYRAVYHYVRMFSLFSEWYSIVFVKEPHYTDPLPNQIQGRIFQGDQDYLYFEINKFGAK